MQHVSSLELMKRAVRCQICTHCQHRPKGSEALGPMQARTCEPKCAIFLNFPILEDIASKHPSIPGAYERAIEDAICEHCHIGASSGEFCANRLNCTCPLATYGKQVIELVEGLLAIR